MFPAIPGRAELLVHTPLFDRITIDRPGGDIVINAPGAGGGYVQALRVDGASTSRAWLPETFATRGGRLDFKVGTTPNRTFGANPADAPPSFDEGGEPYLLGAGPGERTGRRRAARSTPTSPCAPCDRAATVAWRATPPAGITVSPSSGTLRVPAKGAVTTKVRVTVRPDVALGFHTVPIVAGEATGGIRLNVAERGTLAWHANNAGIGDAAAPDEANIDGPGFSFSAQALADVGIEPGGSVDWKGFTFTWPDRRPGEWDNLRPGTAPIEVAAPDGASKIAFLGAGVNGWPESKVTITYTDGSTSTGKLGLSEWILDFGGEPPAFGNEIVAGTPYRLFWGSWALQPIGAHMFAAQPIALDPAKKVASLTFAPAEDGELHLFAWAFS